jgi:hypothetical protein
MSANDVNWDSTQVSNLFKVKYDRLLTDIYNNENTLLGKLKKNENKDFVGSQIEMPVNFGFAGGVGSGSIPEANPRTVNKMTLTRKKVYAKGLIDRESLKAASKAPNAGAFVKLTEEPAKATVESFMRNLSRILFGAGDGSLGAVHASTAVTGSNPYTVTLAASQALANYEESDYVNFGSGTSAFEITALAENDNDATTPAVLTVNRLSGSDVPALSDTIYMQGSKDNDPHGLDEVIDLTTGTHDGISVGRRWQSHQKAAGSSTLDYDLIIEVALEIKRKSGHMPDVLVLPYIQLRKLLISLEDQKSILVPPQPKEINGKLGLSNASILVPGGTIEILADRFCPDARAYLLNTDKRFLSLEMAPDSMGFVDDFQGSIFHSEHINGNDQYSIYYALYGQFKIVPTAHGVITGLSV